MLYSTKLFVLSKYPRKVHIFFIKNLQVPCGPKTLNTPLNLYSDCLAALFQLPCIPHETL